MRFSHHIIVHLHHKAIRPPSLEPQPRRLQPTNQPTNQPSHSELKLCTHIDPITTHAGQHPQKKPEHVCVRACVCVSALTYRRKAEECRVPPWDTLTRPER